MKKLKKAKSTPPEDLQIEDLFWPAQFKRYVEQIKEVGRTDYEKAHHMEDKMHEQALRVIKQNGPATVDHAEIAHQALQSLKLHFPRYTA